MIKYLKQKKRKSDKKSFLDNPQKQTAALLIFTFLSLFGFLLLGYFSFLDIESNIKSIASTSNDLSLQVVNEKIHDVAGIIKTSLAVSTTMIVVFSMYYYFNFKEHSKVNTDSLTGAKNRHFLEYLWEKENYKDYIIVQADIDHFKRINDKYGHDVGDITIKEFAKALMTSVRINKAGDHVIRMGGEEFLILIKHNDNENSALRAVARMQKKVRELKIPVGNEFVNITSSFGVNLAYNSSASPEESIKRSDIALYIAKRERDKIEYFTDDTAKERSVEMQQIHDLIENDGIYCLHQPIINLATGELAKYEALTRIRGTDGLCYSPQTFFALIAGTKAEFEFIKKVCKINIEASKASGKPISINVTHKELMIPELYAFLKDECVKDHLSNTYIEFEISDSDDVIDVYEFEKVLVKIRHLGFKISIDRFGAKYSQILHLMKEIDEIKIDGSIIKLVQYDEKVISQIQSMISFAKNNNIKVAAAHIETEEINNIIKSFGIEFGQGFFLGKPTDLMITVEKSENE